MPGGRRGSQVPWPGLNTAPTQGPEISYYLLTPAKDGPPLPRDPMLIRNSVETFLNGKIVGGRASGKGQRYTLEIASEAQQEKITQMIKLTDGTPCKVTVHEARNVAKCVITCSEATEYTEDTLLAMLKEYKVTKVERNMIRKNGTSKPSNSYVLSLSGTRVPEYIYIGFERCATRNFYPNPLMCQICFAFGHTKNNCKNQTIKCGICSNEHPTVNTEGQTCDLPKFCSRCSSKDHQLRSRLCPQWKMEKNIQCLKVDQKLDYKEAKERFTKNHVRPNQTYAQIAATSELPINPVNTETYTALQNLITKISDNATERECKTNALLEKMEIALKNSNNMVELLEKRLSEQDNQMRLMTQRNERLLEHIAQQQKLIYELTNIKEDNQDDPISLKRALSKRNTEYERLEKKYKESETRHRSRSSSSNQNTKNTNTNQQATSQGTFLIPSQAESQRSSSPGNRNKRSQTAQNDNESCNHPEPPIKTKPNKELTNRKLEPEDEVMRNRDKSL